MSDEVLAARAADSEQAKCHANVRDAISKLHKYYSMFLLIDAELAVVDEHLKAIAIDLDEATKAPKGGLKLAPIAADPRTQALQLAATDVSSMRGALEAQRKRFADVVKGVKFAMREDVAS